MFAVLDNPGATERIDPHRFLVRGWVWLGADQTKISAVEIWNSELLLGSSTQLIARADVNAALNLPVDAHTGFDFYAHHPAQPVGNNVLLHLRARLSSGEHLNLTSPAPIGTLNLGMAAHVAASRPGPPTHEAHTAHSLRRATDAQRDFGVEIGAFNHPIPGIRPLYFDRFPNYDYERVHADYWADACALPVRDHGLDYVANANVFEHLANPVKALWEWARTIRHGGKIYLVIPDRRHTFDYPRPLTPPAHLMEDFERDTTDSDGTHISEYLDGVDWALWAPHATPEARVATREQLRTAYTAAIAAGEDINIHFHTFELSSFVTLLRLMNAHPRRACELELVDASEFFPASYPSGFLVVLQTEKKLSARLSGWRLRRRAHGDPRAVLLPTAQAFSERTHGNRH